MPLDVPSLVIFDCDGTLVDTQAMIVAAMTRAFELHDLAPLSRQRVLSSVGLSPNEALRYLVPHATDATVDSLVTAFKGAYNVLRQQPENREPFYPHVLDTLNALNARDTTLLGIATGKSRRGVKSLLDLHGLDRHFVTIQTADTNPSKPSPVMVERALAEAGCEAHRAVMIGDTVYDIEMALNAGVASVGVAWGYHPPRDLEAAGADVIVTDGANLLVAIDELINRNR
jgi:phosphoglycolate phosphatase